MDKTFVELLNGLLKDKDQVKQISEAIDNRIKAAEARIEAAKEKEFDEKLEEAYAEMAAEKEKSEKIGETGYAEAMTIIKDLRNRLDTQQVEFEKSMDEEYQVAYQMIQSEKEKNEDLELRFHDHNQKKLAEMKEYIVDKVNTFLVVKGQEIYEQARRDIMSDPRVAEPKVVLDKIVDNVHSYLSDEDFNGATSTKLAEAVKKIENLEGEKRILEAKSVRQNLDITKLTEEVRKASELLTEGHVASKKDDKSAAKAAAKKAEGKGSLRLENVAAEPGKKEEKSVAPGEKDTRLVEHFGGMEAIKQMNFLAGNSQE